MADTTNTNQINENKRFHALDVGCDVVQVGQHLRA
jgi:hypothetical protein